MAEGEEMFNFFWDLNAFYFDAFAFVLLFQNRENKFIFCRFFSKEEKEVILNMQYSFINLIVDFMHLLIDLTETSKQICSRLISNEFLKLVIFSLLKVYLVLKLKLYIICSLYIIKLSKINVFFNFDTDKFTFLFFIVVYFAYMKI